ncbi:MAG: acetoacetate--CoA ligase [Bacteroidota bacterium]
MPANLLWEPSTAFVEQSNLQQYQRWLAQEKQLSFPNYHALWQWSTTQVADFWESLWEYFDIQAHQPYERVLENRGMPEVDWFPGATLNYAEHIWRHRNDDRPALIFQNETQRRNVSWGQLEKQVVAIQSFLLAQGIGHGDRVAAYLPNIPEAIACFLAVNGLGAVWSCCSPDFGVETVIERFQQIEPKLLISCDGYRYAGKSFDRLPQVQQLRQAIDSIEVTLFIPYLDAEATLSDSTAWKSMLEAYTSGSLPADHQETDPTTDQHQAAPIFTPVPFAHPIWVLYSSGTTGRPKAITHSHGGVLLEHLKYHAFHNDTKAGENYFWFSTTGWMMWNFLQASMLVGATPVLFDGSPGYPSMEVLWRMAEELPLHHFGTSAPYLTACMKRALQPGKQYDLGTLRSIGSTGAPLPPEAFDWVYQEVKQELWLCSMSGGTDVCTAFVGGIPYQPVRRGHIQGRALGCALHAYNEQGQIVTESLGEMVIDQPMPSMPIYFWNDPGKARYLSSYFDSYPEKWRHGDWIKIFSDGSLIIQGRSDATLNRKGVRIGTAEIYHVLDKLPQLKDALILNLEQADGNDIMPLFVQLAPEQNLTKELVQLIKTELRQQCSPRHVPDEIQAVPDIPYTLSGKKMEVPIKKIFMGMDLSKSLNRDAIRNPKALDYFVELAAKQATRGEQ